jgi:hypothetical protein
MMTRIEAIESLADENVMTLECGHRMSTTAPNVTVGMPWECRLPHAPLTPTHDATLDNITAYYIEAMTKQGHVFGEAERAAVRRAANIQYTWYCAMRRLA